MALIRLALKVETIDEVLCLRISLFFGYALSNNSDEIGDVEDIIVSAELFINLVVVDAVDTDWALGLLIINLRFLDQKSDDVADGARFWCKQVECLLLFG